MILNEVDPRIQVDLNDEVWLKKPAKMKMLTAWIFNEKDL